MTTTQPIPLITSDDGLKATSIENLIQTSLNPELPEVEWLPLTIQQEANKEIMGYEVLQCNNPYDHNDIWETVSENIEPSILEEIRAKCNMRRVYILTPNPTLECKEEEEKQKTSTPNDSDRLYALIEEVGYGQIQIETAIQKAFEIGLEAKNSALISKDAVIVSEVIKLYQDRIDFIKSQMDKNAYTPYELYRFLQIIEQYVEFINALTI